jgi:Putative beta barrel porin-7 (BBP7)
MRAWAVALTAAGLIVAPSAWAFEPTSLTTASSTTLISADALTQPLINQPASPVQNGQVPYGTTVSILPAPGAGTASATAASISQQSHQVTQASCNCESGNSYAVGADGGMSEMERGGPSCQGGASYNSKPCGNDFSWGCGAFPWENGPGLCDDWVVGPRWDVVVEGMTMFRPKTDLGAIVTQARNNLSNPSSDLDPQFENQFDYGVGGRVDVTGHLPDCAGYWVEAAYEGINEWDSSVVFPLTPTPLANTPVELNQQRSIHYDSSLNSAEIDFERPPECCVQPFWGIRYIRFSDRLSDTVNQDISQPPLPSATPVLITATDRFDLFSLENNLIGFQVGAHRATLRLTPRLSFEGTCNAGVYYNQIHRQNLMTVSTTQVIGDNTATSVPGRTDFTFTSNNDVVEFSEISYVGEASLSAVCQLNKCVALRGGYQFMWIDNLRLADDAFLGHNTNGESLVFQGWHVGIECRR